MKFSKQVSQYQTWNKYKYSKKYSKIPVTFGTIDSKYFALNPQDYSLIRNGGHLKNFLHVLILILFLFDLETVWLKWRPFTAGWISSVEANSTGRFFFMHCRNFSTYVCVKYLYRYQVLRSKTWQLISLIWRNSLLKSFMYILSDLFQCNPRQSGNWFTSNSCVCSFCHLYSVAGKTLPLN